jgi:hypothetical protein
MSAHAASQEVSVNNNNDDDGLTRDIVEAVRILNATFEGIKAIAADADLAELSADATVAPVREATGRLVTVLDVMTTAANSAYADGERICNTIADLKAKNPDNVNNPRIAELKRQLIDTLRSAHASRFTDMFATILPAGVTFDIGAH